MTTSDKPDVLHKHHSFGKPGFRCTAPDPFDEPENVIDYEVSLDDDEQKLWAELETLI